MSSSGTVLPPEEVAATIEEAETNLWGRCLEWSKIARVALKYGGCWRS